MCRRLCTIAAIVVVASATSCTSGDSALDQTKLQELATRYTAAWCSQDPARVASFFAETGSLTVNDGEPAVGTDAITEVARGFMTAFPDMVVLMDSLVVGADQAVYHWTLIGTNTGPGGTGNAVHISGREEWEIASDGLIARSKGYFNDAEYRRQLVRGANPPVAVN